MKKLILSIIVLLFAVGQGWGATYFLWAEGTGSKAESTEGTPSGGPTGSKDLDDNFDDNDISDWDAASGDLTVGSGILACVMTGGGSDRIRKSVTSRTEYWESFQIRLVSGHSGWTTGENTQGGGITEISSYAALSYLGIINDSGTLYWAGRYATDASTGTFAATSAVVVTEDIWHDVVLHWKAATGADAEDGIAQAWVDGVIVMDEQAVDIYTRAATGTLIGNNTASTFDATINYDNVVMALTGDVPSGGGGGCAEATAMSIATHNGETFAADDTIYLCDGGGIYRDQLTVPSSGSVGSPITYIKADGDSPTISGADIISGNWSGPDGNGEYTDDSVDVEPYQVFVDNVKWTLGTVTSLGATEWDWTSADGGTLFLGGDPAGTVVEASQRQYCIYASAKDYITIDGIDTTRAGAVGTSSWNVAMSNSDNAILQNFTTTHGYHSGVFVGSGSADALVDNVIATYNGENEGVGIGVWYVNTDDAEVRNCSIHDNYGSGFTSHGVEGTDNGPLATWFHNNDVYDNGRRGISITMAKDCIVEYNNVYNNGLIVGTSGTGIKVSSGDYLTIWNDNNTIRYNTVYGNTWGGISLYREGNFIIQGNIVYDNDGIPGINISDFDGGVVYGNTIYNNDLQNLALNILTGEVVTIKNNIFHSSVSRDVHIYVYSTVAADGFLSDNNVFYNTTYVGAIQSDASYNLADWRTETGEDANSSVADPQMVNPAADDFTLTPGAFTCFAGVAVPGYNTRLDPVTGVAAGSTEEIGAYLCYKGARLQ